MKISQLKSALFLVLSHVLKPLSHACATMRQLDTPGEGLSTVSL